MKCEFHHPASSDSLRSSVSAPLLTRRGVFDSITTSPDQVYQPLVGGGVFDSITTSPDQVYQPLVGGGVFDSITTSPGQVYQPLVGGEFFVNLFEEKS